MKLVTFHHDLKTRIGVLTDDGIADLLSVAPELPIDMRGLLDAGAPALDRVRSVLGSADKIPLEHARLLAPVRPRKVLAIGLNYRAHAEESGMELPDVPLVFTKQITSVTGPYDPIHWSEESRTLDYEGELAIVIGRRCRRVSKADAPNVIAGYCVANDVSVRAWQMRGTPPQFTMGKSWDTHCPLGPAIVTADAFDPNAARLRTIVNDEVRQDSPTDDLIFDCAELIAFLTTAMTLEPGDVIVTGTPSGVGAAAKPPVWLTPCDRVRVEIEGIGAIDNPVIKEPNSPGS